MTYGIILLYYKNYTHRALTTFKSLLDSIDKNHNIIIVSNNSEIEKINIPNAVWITGDNTQAEFSGWTAGLKFIKEKKDNDTYIFANDTFCHHNPWGRYEQLMFQRAFKKIVYKNRKKPFKCLSGTTQGTKKQFTLVNLPFQRWVSSYLFLITRPLLIDFKDSLYMESKIIEKMIFTKNNHIEFSEQYISIDLSSHIQSWLFPAAGQNGWYNSNISLEKKTFKVQSILNEKYISAFAKNRNAKIIEVDIIKKIRLKISPLKKIISK